MTDLKIQKEIGALADLELGLLRSRWFELYGTEAPVRMSRELLIQAIAYRLQENAFGGLSSVTRTAITGVRAAKRVERARIDRRVKAGTRLVRQWQGRTVEVAADGTGGYLYRGRTYRSLSAIAREITGTRWSGPAFFGLTAVGESKHGSV
jgi:hypothetical protein